MLLNIQNKLKLIQKKAFTVDINAQGVLCIDGKVIIKDNKISNAGSEDVVNNVSFPETASAIHVLGNISQSEVGVTVSSKSFILTSGFSSKNAGNPEDYFFADDSDYYIEGTTEAVCKKTVVEGELENAGAYFTGTIKSSVETYASLPAAGTYSISTEAELDTLREWVNTGTDLSDYTFVLKKSIVLSKNWTSIGMTGASGKQFSGTFDGNGYVIKNLTITETSGRQGFFGDIKKKTVIKNLVLDGSITTTSDYKTANYVAGFVGSAESGTECTIDNCVNKINISGQGSTYGGISGYMALCTTLKITNCANYGNIIASGNHSAGICAEAPDSSQLENNLNTGKIEGTVYIAGICGSGKGSILNCVNYGEISATSEGNSFSCHIVSDNDASISYCYYLDTSPNKASPSISVNDTIQSFALEESVSVLNNSVTVGENSYTNLIECLNAQKSTYSYFKDWAANTSGYPILKN